MRAYPLILAALLTGLGSLIVDSGATAVSRPFAAPAAAESGGHRLLTEGRSVDGFGAWSPSGNQVAFMRDGQIWVMNGDGSGARSVTAEGTAWDAAPVWRPDGSRIAFVRHWRSGAGSDVMLLDVKAATTERLTAEPQPVGQLAWTPDGKSLYYTVPQALKRLEVASRRAEPVLAVSGEFDMLAGGLAISPGGKQAVFGVGPRVDRGVLYDLWQVALPAPGTPLRLTKEGGIMPAFSPDGALLAYRNPRQATGIYLLNLADRTNRLVVADEPRALYFHPNFSPDGKGLLLSRLVPVAGPDGSGAARFTSALCVHTLEASGGD